MQDHPDVVIIEGWNGGYHGIATFLDVAIQSNLEVSRYMEYSLRAMELWFQHLPGSLLLELESKALASCFARTTGTHCLQMGGPSDLRLIQSAHYSHKAYLSTQPLSASHFSRVQFSSDELPILSDSVDAIVLAHLLEFSTSPAQLLKEIYRALVPEGQLILLAFNPWSLWGIARLQHGKKGFPWSGKFYSSHKIKHWLRECGYSIVLSKTLFSRPALRDARQSRRWSFIESFGSYFFPGFGAVSLIVAQKQRLGMTPIKVSLNHRRVKVGGHIVEPTTYR